MPIRKGCRPQGLGGFAWLYRASVSHPSFRVQVPMGPKAMGRVLSSKQYCRVSRTHLHMYTGPLSSQFSPADKNP